MMRSITQQNDYYHKMLGMNVDTFTIEKMFLELDPNFEKLRDLKEDYIEFNNQEYEMNSMY